jgi:hypothetical protein
MNNSTNKWPYNYKLFQSAIHPSAPVLEIISSTVNSVELVWSIKDKNNICYPVSKFFIFVNNSLYKTILYSTNYTTTLTDLPNGPYEIYIIGELSNNSSPPSNVVTYNNEIVAKVSLTADNQTYSDNVTDLSNEIRDIASGNGINNGTSSGSGGAGTSGRSIFNSKTFFYIIEDANINNESNAIFIPDRLITENNKSITIVNKTSDILIILSTTPIHNVQYAPTNGTNMLEISQNSLVVLTYVYDVRNNLSIYANVN